MTKFGGPGFQLERLHNVSIIRITSPDGTNRLIRSLVAELSLAIQQLSQEPSPKSLIITGNDQFFSAGADLQEIASLTASAALEFARAGQALMELVAQFPAATCAAVSGYCMGGGLDLALASQRRLAAPNAVFGHRGAALGLITGWGGTQRLPRLIGKGFALQMFVAAEKVSAAQALAIRLVERVVQDPVNVAITLLTGAHEHGRGES